MIGFLLAGWRAAKHAPRYGFRPEDVWDVALFGLLGGVLGGRIGFVIQEPAFWHHFDFQQLVAIWQGGMTFYGGLLGGILAGVITCRVKGMRVADMADLAGVSFPIGYIFGRIGCLLNGCCYGGKCDLPWAMRFRADDGTLTPPSHPAQIYSAIAGLIIFLLLLPIERNRKFRGQVMYSFLFLYGIYRFLIEFVRDGASSDSSTLHWAITDAQAASLLLSLVAAALYVYAAGKAKGSPAPTVPAEPEKAPAAAAAPAPPAAVTPAR